MARPISVKVATHKVISALEAKLAEDVANVAHNKKAEADHKIALEAYYKSIVNNFADKLEIHNVNTRWNGQIEVTYNKTSEFIVPEQPTLDRLSTLGTYEVQEIENAIRILKMTDEEVVNATTFKSIAQYL
jgi:hypothetical protein